MALALRPAAALLIGAGGAGAVTMLPLLLTDGLGPEAMGGRLLLTAVALLLSLPMALGLTSLLKPAAAAPREARNLAVFGAMFWLGGLGIDLFNVSATVGMLTAAHAAALLGGVSLAGAGAWAMRPRASNG